MSERIPSAPGQLPVLGHGLPMMRRPLAFLGSLPAHGPIVKIRMGALPAYVVNDPELARQVLVGGYDQGLPVHKARPLLGGGVGMLDGEDHRWHRRLMQPALSRAQIANYAPIMSELAVSWCDSLLPGQRLDVAVQMNELALLTVATTLFSADLRESVAEVQRVLPVALRHLPRRAVLPDWLLRLPLPANRAFDEATRRLHRLTREAVAATRTNGADHTDLISILLASRDKETGVGLSDEQVNDQLVNMLVAGSETTGSTLAWAFHELAGAAEAETRLHDELDRVLAGRPATFEDLPNLPYTRWVIQEALRRYPPYLILRHAPDGARLGGYHLPAGASILISPYVLHRDPQVFTEPTRFEPQRWAAGTIGRTASVPFGLGGRQCPGNHFALTELAIHLATIAGRWRLLRVPGPAVAEVPRGVVVHPDRLAMLAEPRPRDRRAGAAGAAGARGSTSGRSA
jgi:pentalenene oxygenase